MITIYKITDAYLEIAGIKHPVAAFKLSMLENGISNITVTTDSHTYNKDANKSTPPLTIFTPGDLLALYNKFQTYCEARTPANFVFTAINVGSNGTSDSQTVTLPNWICSSAGFASVSATGYSAFDISLQHPVYLLGYGCSGLLSAITRPDEDLYRDTMEKTTNPGNGLTVALSLYSEAVSNTEPATVDLDTLEVLKNQFDEATNLFTSTVKNQLTTYPFGGKSLLLTGITMSMFDYASAFTENSIWNVLVGRFCSELSLSLKPDYSYMYLSTFQPWGPVKYTININNITSMQLPSYDAEPVNGATCLVPDDIRISGNSLATSSAGDVSEPTMPGGDIHIEFDKDGNPVKGITLRTPLPAWFIRGVRDSEEIAAGTLTPMAAGVESIEALILHAEVNGWKDELLKVIQTLFLTRYKHGVSMVFSMPLCLNYNNTPFLPGAVCSIVDADGTTELLRGYITNLLHVVDINAKQTQTEVSMRYVRPKDFKVMDSVKGVKLTPIWD